MRLLYHHPHIMRITRSIEVAAPPETVWAVMSDVARWPDWTPSVEAVELLDAAFAPGSRVRLKQPRFKAAVWRVTALEPGRGFAWENRVPGMTSIARHGIEVTPTGVRVTLEFAATGPLSILFSLLYGRLSQRYVEMEAAGLKRHCEAREARQGGMHA